LLHIQETRDLGGPSQDEPSLRTGKLPLTTQGQEGGKQRKEDSLMVNCCTGLKDCRVEIF